MHAILEGLLFVVGDDGLSIREICEILEIDENKAKKLIEELQSIYISKEHGIEIKDLGNKYKLTTKKEHKDYYKKLNEISNSKSLSQSALETLAIIAYNEPITRMQIDALRGINSSQMIRSLIAKDLVKEIGRAETVGKPRLFGITDTFLDYFGLSSKNELPKFAENIKNDDVNLYNSKYKEEEIL